MNHTKLIDELLQELSYRVGIVNIYNKEQQSIMSEILTEWGEFEVKELIFEFLNEEDREFTNPILNKKIKYVGKDGKEKEGTVGNLLTAPKDSPGRIEAEKQLPKEGTPEREEINQEIGSQGGGGPQADTKGGGTDNVEQDTQRGSAVKKGTKSGDSYHKNVVSKEEETQEKIDDEDGDSNQVPDSTTKEEKEEFNKSLNDSISKLREKRRTGDSGAGGAAASYGESVFSDNITSLDLTEFQKENEKEIQTEVETLKKKKLNKEQKLVVQNMGLKPPPDEEGIRYLASRKVFFNQELEKAKSDTNHVFHKDSGFNKDVKSFETWMNAAFDGAISTRELLEEGNEIDTSRPHTCVQSDPSVDKKVLAELEKRRDNAKSDEERKHYEREIYFFKKSGKYHDTYVVGEDSKGRMTIVSVTNKAASNLKDPHNNTTPANRLSVLEGKYDETTQKIVIDVIKEGIQRVTAITDDTKKNSVKIEVDESFAKLARIAGPKYFKDIDKRGTNRKKTKAGGPSRGAEFGHFLDEEKVSVEKWNSISDVEKLKLVQKYNASNNVAYDPYAKIFIKVGEVNTGGHNQLLKVRLEAEKQGIDLNASNIQEVGDIKRNEQGAVKETHEKVVKTIYDSDKQNGYPKTDGNGDVVENGPAARAYIDTVLDALHFTSYIDFDDKDDDKLIAQMGIRGAKPSDIRNCLADLSGYGDIPPGTREGLKEYLRNTSTIDAESGAIIIKSKKNGQVTQLAEDTWRTAGTSQKVASSFGNDMQECVGAKVDKRRSNKK
jgi:hypothetical protein